MYLLAIKLNLYLAKKLLIKNSHADMFFLISLKSLLLVFEKRHSKEIS